MQQLHKDNRTANIYIYIYTYYVYKYKQIYIYVCVCNYIYRNYIHTHIPKKFWRIALHATRALRPPHFVVELCFEAPTGIPADQEMTQMEQILMQFLTYRLEVYMAYIGILF